ncbi:MAG: ParB/RepB/Spo0J family partition protein [bacterium]
MSKRVLGKGLSALISNLEYPTNGEILEIPIENLSPNPGQPRKYFDGKKMEELASSIREKGVIQPIFARKNDEGYTIIAGERRWRAAQKAGLKRMPVIVKNVTEQEELELSLIENVQREDINPIEEGEAFQRLIETFNYSQDHLAGILGKDKSTVSNILRLLKLEEPIKEGLRQGLLTMGHARSLLSIPDSADRLLACKKIVQQGLSVREAERLVKNYGGARKKPNKGEPGDESKNIFIRDLEEDLRSTLGTFVKIKTKRDKGSIEITYSSREELERIISLIRN